jgi:Skp family chaperone for outer membrane proteins
LHGTDAAAAQSAEAEIASLQKQRADLYAEMVDQIGREVKTIAQQRGISVVVSDVAAPAGGVDLTDDAMKDIETLHE